MNEGESVGFTDLLRVKVYDSEGLHIGHIQDMALERTLTSPDIGYLGVHLLWTEHIGPIELVRPVEDIVVLLDWSEVDSFSEEEFRLSGVHPKFSPVSAENKWLIRRDILNKQMLDSRGNRIQRVDDVLLRFEGGTLTVDGLEVNKGLLWTSSGLRRYIAELRKKHLSKHDSDVIPWEAVVRIDEGTVVIGDRAPE